MIKVFFLNYNDAIFSIKCFYIENIFFLFLYNFFTEIKRFNRQIDKIS